MMEFGTLIHRLPTNICRSLSTKPIDRGEAILVIAAVAAPLVRQMRVDVVGLDRQRQANEGSGNEGKPDKHVTLPALGGVGAGSERREAARGARSIASLRG